MFDPMTFYLWCGGINIALGGAAALQKQTAFACVAWGAAVICWTIQAACFFYTFGGASLSGVAPTFCLAALVLCVWQIPYLKSDCGTGVMRPRMNAVFLVMLACMSLVTENYRHDSFMMNYIFARLFFLSRPLSLGLTLFALGGARESLFLGGTLGSSISAHSRQVGLLAALIFLGGEIAGCYWGFMGWGTTWRWSGNFYFSAMLFVLYMVALHVPRSVFSSAKAYAWGLYLPLAAIAVTMTLSKVMNL